MALTRRKMLAGSLPAIGGVIASTKAVLAGEHMGHNSHHQPASVDGTQASGGVSPHGGFQGGAVNHQQNGFDPADLLRDFDYGKVSKLASGQTLREWKLVAQDQELELAPGIKFQAWTYNGRVPGPTLRAKEGERLRIRFINGSAHPHTIHFHGLHTAAMDGVPGIGAGELAPGEETVYEFDAQPFGLHLYHCHSRPLAEHIAKGLYGAFIIDPAQGRSKADEQVMVMNGFDTNFDRQNEIYAVNTIGFEYMHRPIKVKRNELVRIYLVNALEYDLINSFHLHGNFFNYFPTGTSLEPSEFTDTITQCQGQRGIIELRFPNLGKYMFHAHQSEFAELGWQGFFEVVE